MSGPLKRVNKRCIAGLLVTSCLAIGAISPPAHAGTPIFSDSFETGDLSAWSSPVGMTVQQNLVHSGAWAARGTSSGSPTWAFKNVGTQTDLSYTALFNIASRTGAVTLVGLRTSSGSVILKVFLTKRGRLAYTDLVTKTTVTSKVSVGQGVWHELRIRLLINGTIGQLETSLDGAQVATLTTQGNFGTNPIGRAQLGNSERGRAYDVAFDDVVIEMPAVNDGTPPSVPDGLTATAITSTQVDLGWTASTDDVGVDGYTIFRDGNVIDVAPGLATTYSDTTASPSTAYSYTVDAFDAAGNHSAASVPATATTPDVSASRPNVLIFVTDDQREGLNVMPKTLAWLGDGGVQYQNAFVTTPLCCPSRSSILTGRYAHNTTVTLNGLGDQLDQTTTVPYALHRAGYRTAIFGKFLNGWTTDPPNFDRWAIFRQAQESYINAEWNVQGTTETIPQYATRFISDQAVSFLSDPQPAPWLLYLAPPNPHPPFTPEDIYANASVPSWDGNPAVFEQDRSDKPPYVQASSVGFDNGNKQRIAQLRTLMSVDDMVDEVMTTLRDTGQLSNTLVFFISDNGFLWGEHGLSRKEVPYTQSVQVPMFARWDGHLSAGTIDQRLVANIDIAPTIYDATGIAPPTQVDGHSLLSSFSRDHLLLEFWTSVHDTTDTPSWASIRSAEGQYIETYDDAGNVAFAEFYDLTADPWQLDNLGVAPAGWADELAAARTCSGTSCP